MTFKETVAMRHALYYAQSETAPHLREKMYDRGWLTKDPEILSLLARGVDQCYLNIASGILEKHREEIFMNTCPRCNGLARTISARQCPHCFYSWHHQTVAELEFRYPFPEPGTHFTISGRLISGTIATGHYLDLTSIGINQQPCIISFTQEDGHHEDLVTILTNGLTETRKQLLVKAGTRTIHMTSEKRV